MLYTYFTQILQNPLLVILLSFFSFIFFSFGTSINYNRISKYISAFIFSIIFTISIYNIYFQNYTNYNIGNLYPGISLTTDPISYSMCAIIAFVFIASIFNPELKNRFGFFIFFGSMCFSLISLGFTSDVFNIYVLMEISSISMCLIVAGTSLSRYHRYNEAFNLLITLGLSSMMFTIGILLLYQQTGTLSLNMQYKDLVSGNFKSNFGSISNITYCMLIIPIIIKAGIFPFHIWMQRSYKIVFTPALAAVMAISSKAALIPMFKINSFFASSNTAEMYSIGLYTSIFSSILAYIGSLNSHNAKSMIIGSSIGTNSILCALTFFPKHQTDDVFIAISIIHSIAVFAIMVMLRNVESEMSIKDKISLRDINEFFLKLNYSNIFVPMFFFIFFASSMTPITYAFISKLHFIQVVIYNKKLFGAALIIFYIFLSYLYFITFMEKSFVGLNYDSQDAKFPHLHKFYLKSFTKFVTLVTLFLMLISFLVLN